jgi:hypothetical protein
MSNKPKESYIARAAERRRRTYVVLSSFLAFVIGFGALAPIFTSNIQQAVPPTEAPTVAPRPTQIADLTTITFDRQAVSQSGLFSVAVPSGWEVTSNNALTNEAQLTQRNATAESVIEARVIAPPTPVTNLDELSAFFSTEWLSQSWREYTRNTETARRLDTETNELVLDFNLARGTQDFIARQLAWTDGTWIYLVRVVTPPNAPEQLVYVLDNLKASLRPNTQFVGAPFDWQSHFDTSTKTLIRFPASWSVADTAPGAPTSLTGDNATLRVETITATVADQAAAEAWVQTTYGATVVSAVPVERSGLSGYGIAYSVANPDGGSSSGYAVMLVGEGVVNVANLTVPQAGVDLNDAASLTNFANFKGIMDSFGVFADVNA